MLPLHQTALNVVFPNQRRITTTEGLPLWLLLSVIPIRSPPYVIGVAASLFRFYRPWSEETLKQSLRTIYRLLFYLPLYRWVVKLRFYLNNLRAIIYFISLTLYKYYIMIFSESQILNQLFKIFILNFDNNTISTSIFKFNSRSTY